MPLYRHCYQGEYSETLGQNAWMTTDFTGTIKGAHAAMGSAYTQALAWIWRASRPHPKLTFNLRVKALTFIFTAISVSTPFRFPNTEMSPSIKPWDITLHQTLRCHPPSLPWDFTLHQTLTFHPPSNPERSLSIKPWDFTLQTLKCYPPSNPELLPSISQNLWFHRPSNPEITIKPWDVPLHHYPEVSSSVKPWDFTLYQTLRCHPPPLKPWDFTLHQTLKCYPPPNPEISPFTLHQTMPRFYPPPNPEMSPSIKPCRDFILHQTLRCHPPSNPEMSTSIKPWDFILHQMRCHLPSNPETSNPGSSSSISLARISLQ